MSLGSFRVISICVRASLNVLRQVLVGLLLFLLPSRGTHYVFTCIVSSLGKRSITPPSIRRRVLAMSGRLSMHVPHQVVWSLREIYNIADGTRLVVA